MLNLSTEKQNQTPLTEESLGQMLYEKLNEAYRKGYNNACDVLSQVILAHAADFGDPKIKMVVEGLALTIKKCHLKEDGVTLNG
jgi:hypothetical protein